MVDDTQVVGGINWRETFPFTHIFRSFRIAIHPSKLVLAFLAILSLYLGGRILDAVWPSQARAVPGEIIIFDQSPERLIFLERRAELRERIITSAALRLLAMDSSLSLDAARERVKQSPRAAAKLIAEAAQTHLREDLQAARAQYDKNTAEGLPDARARLVAAQVSAVALAKPDLELAEQLRGKGLFLTLFEYETAKIDQIIQGVLAWNWFGGMPGGETGRPGIVLATWQFFTVAPAWALRYHTLYFVLFFLLFLAVWSLFGGAIARIAAVHAADEGRKLSVRQGLGFSVSKFLSFLSAPLIPLIIIGAIGVIMAIAAGILFLARLEIVVGLLFFLMLTGAFVMTLVVLGTAGGFNLMYPTIAVEGSDSFDAISRSFSYVYARPWRMLFYSGVALVYGALTYLFVRLVIWLVLILAHTFMGLLVFRQAPGGENLWSALMPFPQFWDLPYAVNSAQLSVYGQITAWFIAFWNYLLIAMLGAFAISFYFSANTIIYFLMRREVDATEMDDVYLEQPEEEFIETPAAAAPAGPAAAPDASATQPPAPSEPHQTESSAPPT